MLLAKKKHIVVGLEGTYGVDSNPAQAIQTSELSIEPLLGPEVSRNLDRATLGNDLQVLVGSYVELSFKVEMAGSGVVATAPVYRDLLLGAGWGEIVFAGTSVAYFPVSANFDSNTIYFRHDGQLHKLLGARGSVALELDARDIPRFAFKYKGIFATPESQVDPTPDFSGHIPALPVNNNNTTTFSLHGQNLIMDKFGIDMANVVDYDNFVGEEAIVLSDRLPVGNTTFKTVPISVKNWFLTALNNELGALSFVHGTQAGNIVTVTCPAVQVRQPKYEGDRSSLTSAGLTFLPTAVQNDDVSIIFT